MKVNHLHDLKGERKDQLLVLVDKKGKPKGLATRVECHEGRGKSHLAFMAFVINNKGKIVLARRSRKKSLWATYWDASVVSHVLPGETVEQAAERRGKEELGIEVEFKNLGSFYYFAKHGHSAENEYCHVLIGKTKKEVQLNPVEISEIKLMATDELERQVKLKKGKFTPWLELAFEKICLQSLSI